MKANTLILWFLKLSMYVAILVLTVLLVQKVTTSTPPSYRTTATVQYNDVIIKFITSCSGLDASDEAIRLIGMANCLGRLRGFVDGHQMTIQMQKNANVPMPALWCVDSNVTDKDILDVVTTWISTHPAEAKEITDQFTGINAAIAITIRAVHVSYPCQEIK